jgi:hypothetical protein
MHYKDILKSLGPCGINCEKCFAFTDGKIKYHSRELKNYLGSFEIYAKRFVELLNDPVFENYPGFNKMLDHFSNVGCKGCRSDECKIFPGCKVKECSRNMKVDYCFLCTKFPCETSGFDGHLKKRWIHINNRMKETGVEKYFEETRDLPRY